MLHRPIWFSVLTIFSSLSLAPTSASPFEAGPLTPEIIMSDAGGGVASSIDLHALFYELRTSYENVKTK